MPQSTNHRTSSTSQSPDGPTTFSRRQLLAGSAALLLGERDHLQPGRGQRRGAAGGPVPRARGAAGRARRVRPVGGIKGGMRAFVSVAVARGRQAGE